VSVTPHYAPARTAATPPTACRPAALLGGNDSAVVVALRLCRRPGAAEPNWTAEEEVEEIARRFAVDAVALARIVREVGSG
jgi:hypothetical protein